MNINQERKLKKLKKARKLLAEIDKKLIKKRKKEEEKESYKMENTDLNFDEQVLKLKKDLDKKKEDGINKIKNNIAGKYKI